MFFDDTIVAQATPPGRGSVSIIRVSGPQAQAIAQALVGFVPKPRYATHVVLKDDTDSILDKGLVIYFQKPHSFTGEDVLEIHGHGNPVIVDQLIHYILKMGARMARPGEFSERAFHHNKIDLTQAEAISDLIHAHSFEAAQSAMRSLQGEFSEKIRALVDAAIHLRMFVEAAIDFPEEEINFLEENKIQNQLKALINRVTSIKQTAKQGVLLREGMTIVIAGEPNVGKSSLLNYLSGRETAIVTPIAGTTRDLLRESIQIDGMPLHVVDTAGLRDSGDIVEQEGMRRATQAMETADRILWMVDASQMSPLANIPAHLPKISITIIKNKIDLTQEMPEKNIFDEYPIIKISVKTGAGMDLLKQHLKDCVGFQSTEQGVFIARRRHLDALNRAKSHLENAVQQLLLHHAGELLAEDLRAAQKCLSEIIGEFTTDDLLGKIFSEFCIGK